MPECLPGPRVSVLLPVYNCARTLGACLDSLLAQDLDPFEIVAVDDGSSDPSSTLLHAYARRDARLRVIQQAHGGLVVALERGLDACRAPLIARMDGDDRATPDRLRLQADWLEQRPGTGLVSCLVIHGGGGHQSGYARHVQWLNSLDTPEQIRRARFIDACVAHPSVMFRRELVDRFGGYREGPFPEDFELWLRWLDAGVVFEKVPRVLLEWNDPPRRLSRQDPRYLPEAFDAVRLYWLQRELARVLEGRPLLCWGAGRESRRRVRGLPIAGWLELHPGRIGQRLWGAPVRHRDELAPGEGFVLATVGRTGAREEIAARLEALGYREGRDWLALA